MKEALLKNLGLLAIAIALLIIAIAIWNHQRYIPLHNVKYIDSRTGECYTPEGERLGR